MMKGGYMVIPNQVAYDDALPPKAILVYGDISNNFDRQGDGYTIAPNWVIAARFNISKGTVSKYISMLEQQGHIYTQIIYVENSKEIAERRIYFKY